MTDSNIGSGVSATPTSVPAEGTRAEAPEAAATTAASSPAAAAPAAGETINPPAIIPAGQAEAGGEAAPMHHGIGDKMLHGILDALGGTEKITYTRDPQTGALIANRAAMGTGQQFKRIIAGAMVGAAAGAGAKPGAGHNAEAFSLGAKAGSDLVQGQQDRSLKLANEDFEGRQKALVANAQVAHLNQEVARSIWSTERETTEMGRQFAADAQAFKQQVESDEGNQDFGTYASFDEFVKTHAANAQEIAQLNSRRGLTVWPAVENGKVVGVHVYKINPVWSDQMNAAPEKMNFPYVDKNGEMQDDWQTIPVGAYKNGDILKMRQANILKKSQWGEERYKQAQENQRNRTTAGAHVEAARVAAASRESVASTNASSREKVAGGKEARQNLLTHDKDYVKPANLTEASYQLADRAYKEFKTAQAQGKDLPSGAQSMVMLSQHLGTTFGNIKGSRITKDMIQEHLGARSISDAAQVAVQRLSNGDALSPAQWDAFHGLLSDARQIKWEIAAKEARRKSVPMDFLPDDLQGLAAPKGATGEVHDQSGKLIGHVVKNTDGTQKYVALGGE